MGRCLKQQAHNQMCLRGLFLAIFNFAEDVPPFRLVSSIWHFDGTSNAFLLIKIKTISFLDKSGRGGGGWKRPMTQLISQKR